MNTITESDPQQLASNAIPKITEADAQQLANIMHCWIAVDSNGLTHYSSVKPFMDRTCWVSYAIVHGFIPVLIASDRPWTEQIWGPHNAWSLKQ